MPEVEFVNRELAESEAARAIGLLNQSDEAKVEAWFAMQAVADQVGPASNVGVRGVGWYSRIGKGYYRLHARCAQGHLQTTMAAPATLEEARGSDALEKAVAMLGRKVEELGGQTKTQRPSGTRAALLDAVVANDAGRRWAEGIKTAGYQLLEMVRVADAYGREGVFPGAGLGAHGVLALFDDRADLIRAFPRQRQAEAKALSLRAGRQGTIPGRSLTYVSPAKANRLAVRAGISSAEARVILRAVIDGRSKAKLMRAVNEAVRMVDEMEAREARGVAA